MLVEQRRRHVVAPGGLAARGVEEAQRRAGQRDRPERGVLDVDQQPLATRLVPLVDLVEGAHLAGGYADLVEAGEQRGGVVLGEGRLDDLDGALAGADTVAVGLQPRRGRVDAEAGAEPAPQALAAHRDLHGPVPAAEETVRRDRGVVVALRATDLAGHRPAGALEGVHAHEGRQQGGAHDLAAAGGRALVDRGEDAVRAVHAGEQVPDRYADALRVVGTGAGEGHDPGLALRDLVVAGPPALGAVVAEAGDRQHHEPRVALHQRVDPEPEALEHPGAEVLDQHVGAVHEPQEHLAVRLGLEVEGDRLLVAVGREEVRRLAIVLGPDERRPPAPGVVPVARCLDLDDPGAEVAQHHRGVRSGQRAGEVDDQDPVERAGHEPHPGRTRAAHTASGPTRVTMTP